MRGTFGLRISARTTMLAAAMLLGGALGAAADSSPATRPDLTGTWRVVVTPVSCATGTPAGPPFRSLLTFGNGTMTGTTLNGAFQPGQRTSDFGVWQRTGNRTFEAVSEAFILFDSTPNPPLPAFVRGTQRLVQAIRLQGSSFTSVAVSTFHDVAGNLVSTVCANATATRLE